MKTLDVPSTGKRGNSVARTNHYGAYLCEYVVPNDPKTEAQREWRGDFGTVSAAWRKVLTLEQRLAWCAAAEAVPSCVRLGRSRPLTGQAHFVGINSVLARLGREIAVNPPLWVGFDRSPVQQLKISKGEGGLRLKLKVAGPVGGEIMVYGTAPCSAGRMKHPTVRYLGLLPAPEDGESDITEMYCKVFGVPPAGGQVFICTRQQLNGWEADEIITRDIVPA